MNSNGFTVTQLEFSPLRVVLVILMALVVCLIVVLRVSPISHLPAILLGLASLGFLVGGGKNPDLLHPVRILGALWCFCLALGSLKLLSIISDWDSLMWLCVITGLVTFIGGFWIGERTVHERSDPLFSNNTVSAGYWLPNGRVLAVAILCLLMGAGVLAYEDYLIGGIPILSDNADFLRMELFGGAAADPRFDSLFIKSIHMLVEGLKYSVFLACIVLFQKGPKSKKIAFSSVLIIVIGTLIYGSQAGRTFFVEIAVTGLVLFHYLRRRIRLTEIVASVVILFLFVGLFGSARIKRSGTAPIFEAALRRSEFPQGDFGDGLAFGYATTTISFEVFYRLTEDFRMLKHPPGGFLFYSLHRFIRRSSLGDVATDLYSGESTTSTFLGDFYGDYGYPGVFFGPLIMGFFYGWAYAHKSGDKPLYWIYVRALLLQMLIFFPYVNLFSLYLTWVFDLIAMYFLFRITDLLRPPIFEEFDSSLPPVSPAQ